MCLTVHMKTNIFPVKAKYFIHIYIYIFPNDWLIYIPIEANWLVGN